MGIGAVSGVSSYSYTPSTEQNDEVKTLEKQKEQLQKQKESINRSNMDQKLKQETIRQLDDQIAEIETQIREKKMEKLRPDSAKDSSSSQNSSSNTASEISKTDIGISGSNRKTGDGINSEHMISAVSGYNDLKTMSKVRTDLQGQLRLATSSGENPEAGAGIQAKIDQLEGDMSKKETKIQDDLKKAAEDVKNAEPVEIPEDSQDEKKEVNGSGDQNTESTSNQNADSAVSEDSGVSRSEGRSKPSESQAASNNSSSDAKDSDHDNNKNDLEILPEGSYIDVRV